MRQEIKDSTIRFENGAGCPGGIRRNGFIHLSCGDKETITKVKEVSTCVYDIEFETTVVCSLNSWNKDSLVMYSH